MSFSQKKFDVVLLKSGGKVVGTILEKHENQFVVLQLQSGDHLTIKWSEIKAFDVMIIREKSIDEKLKEDATNDTDFPWRLMYNSGDNLHLDELDSLSDTHLFALRNDTLISIPIDSIAVLVHFKKGHFWIGAGIGFLAGAFLGGIIGDATAPKGSDSTFGTAFTSGFNRMNAWAGGVTIGAALGFVAGGILSAGDSYETYDLRAQKDIRIKWRILQQAIRD